MPNRKVPLDYLQFHLPPGTSELVIVYLKKYCVYLTITRERQTILGNYRHKTEYANHRISVNGTLNRFSFLITLLHELAHLVTFEMHGNRVQSHGWEWKFLYGQLLSEFLDHKIFPPDIEKELRLSLKNPAASSCAEEGLLRVLRSYDEKKNGYRMIEELTMGTLFKTKDGRVFQRGIKLRKRFKCKEVKTGREYLFSPVYEVVEVSL